MSYVIYNMSSKVRIPVKVLHYKQRIIRAFEHEAISTLKRLRLFYEAKKVNDRSYESTYESGFL